MLAFILLQVLLVQNAFLVRVVEDDVGVMTAKSFFSVLGNVQRAEGRGVNESLEGVMHVIEDGDETLRVRSCVDALLASGGLHEDGCDARTKQPPVCTVSQGLHGKTMVGGGWLDARRGVSRLCGRLCFARLLRIRGEGKRNCTKEKCAKRA